MMDGEIPSWLQLLDDEDIQFIKRLVLASGSLKTLAEEYGITYPTLRIRLDRLIKKVKAADNPKIDDPFQKRLQVMMTDGVITSSAAKKLMKAYKQSLKKISGNNE
jgi:hypothetical protein